MAINFPDSPSNGDTTTLAGKTYIYDSSKGKWSPSGAVTLSSFSVGAEGTASGDGAIAYNGAGVFSYTPPVLGGTGVTVHNNQSAMLNDAGSADEGSLHYENNLNKLYVKSAAGFFLLATISNVAPTIDSFTETTGSGSSNTITDGGTFTLTAGSTTTITLGASDANLDTLTFSATLLSGTASNVITSPSLPVSNQSGNTFTLTPATSVGGTIAIRFDVTDGTNVTSKTHSFVIEFSIANSRYTSFLLAANATGRNFDFLDSNTQVAAKTINTVSVLRQGSYNPYRFGGFSTHIDSNDLLTVAPSTDFNIANENFTISFWVKPTITGTDCCILRMEAGNNSNPTWLRIDYDNSNGFRWMNDEFSSSYIGSTPSTAHSDGLYHFVSLTRDGTNYYLHLDGTREHTYTNNSTNFTANTSAQSMYLGGQSTDVGSFHGFLRDVHFVKGSATYGSANYDVPSTPASPISGTKLLACSLPYIADANTQVAAKTITVSGDPKLVPSGPYDYAEATLADGSSITFPDAAAAKVATSSDFEFGTGEFCIEFWWRPEDSLHLTKQGGLIDFRNTTSPQSAENTNAQRPAILIDDSPAVIHWTGANTLSYATSNFSEGNFYHIAVSRDSSNNLSLYVNGTRQATASSHTVSYTAPISDVFIGNWYATSTLTYANNHTLSDVRIIKGSTGGREGDSFDVPTSPLTAVTNTKLLLSGTGTRIFDKAQKHNLIVHGGAAGSSTAKFGSSFSVTFDGINDYVSTFSDDSFALGTGSFTIEAWIRKAATGSTQTIAGTRTATSDTTGWSLVVNSSNQVGLYTNAYQVLGGSISATTWYFIEIAYDASTSTLNLYIDGTHVNSGTQSQTFSKDVLSLGTAFISGSQTQSWSGQIQDFRLTKGFARHTGTSSYSVPTAPLKG